MLDQKEHVNIIYPEEGKRYRLNVRTAVGRLSVGKVKQCLAAASSCPIPLPDMVLHLNGVPLSNDRDLCESLGIGNGATLSVEARAAPPSQQQQQPSSFLRREAEMGSALESDPFVSRARSDRAHTPSRATTPPPPPPPPPSSVMSEQRRLLELQTLEQQDAMLHKDVAVRDDILRSTLHHVDDEMDQASLRRRQLERQRENAEEELRRMHEKEAAAAAERQRLATLRAQEAARATARAAELAKRREQMRAEQEATRAVSLLKLENEKKKATLAQQKSLLEAERERALLEQDSFEAATKVRELELRSREIDMEHQRLARIREARALEADRRMSVKQRLHYYERLGVEPPRALQREAATLLMRRDDSADDDESEAADASEAEDEEAHSGQRRGPKHFKHSSSGTQKADRVGLVQSRGPSHASVNATASPSLPRSPPHRSTQNPGPAAAQQQQQQQRSPSSTLAASSPKTKYNSDVAVVPDGGFYDARENAEENLRRLGDDLGLSGGLAFDDSDTCVISIDGAYTLLVTYDAATERLYLYSTLLAALPPSVRDTPEGRLRLYEFLLEASLLGREMCGGGVGASMRNNFVLMSASLYMPTSQPWSLRTLAPQFMHCLQHWRGKLTEFLQELERSPTLAGASPQEPQHGFWSEPPPVAPSAHASSSPPSRATWSQQSPQPQQQQQYSNYNGVHGVSPSRSPVGSVSPSQASPSQARDGNTRSASKVIPVLGLEVTGTVLVNGMPTHYDNGVLVVNAAGPSVLAGIQPNDFVEELNGVPIRSVNEFRRVIEQQLVPGMLAPIRINRGGVAMIVTVRVEAAWSL